jgi:hypothetical protein
MAKTYPYHTASSEYGWEHRNVYHNDDACPDGKRIEPRHRVNGTAGRPLCKECAKL